jgi:hypothetical protein
MCFVVLIPGRGWLFFDKVETRSTISSSISEKLLKRYGFFCVLDVWSADACLRSI